MVYAEHLKCFARKGVWVRVPPWAPPRRDCCGFTEEMSASQESLKQGIVSNVLLTIRHLGNQPPRFRALCKCPLISKPQIA